MKNALKVVRDGFYEEAKGLQIAVGNNGLGPWEEVHDVIELTTIAVWSLIANCLVHTSW